MNRVNSTIGLIFAVSICAGFFLGKVNEQAFEILAGVCIGFFFPKGSDNTLPGQPK